MSGSPHHSAESVARGPASAAGSDFADEPLSPARSRRERLGAVLIVTTLERPVVGRLWAFGIALACAGALGTAAWLHASRSGFGTHRQLGLPDCGFLVQTGYPCITCGMTTAFADFTKGRFLRSFLDQPAGFALALAVAVIGVVSLGAAITGRAVGVNWYRVNPVRCVWAAVFLLLGGWAFKIIHGLAAGVLPAR